ncbi:IS110 family transposase [Solibacillus daqui]|uniref:IS110 family transposase n=1 Tax=Solibacillus daqui TaxID=2912187 RepID=UPI0023673623|nr:transposase [Solibacillus daqui]
MIGIDIAKHNHIACAIDVLGRVLQKSFPILQSRIEFEAFYEHLLTLKASHEKQGIPVGFESTVQYWMNLASFFNNYLIPFVMGDPMYFNSSKKLDVNLQTKK